MGDIGRNEEKHAKRVEAHNLTIILYFINVLFIVSIYTTILMPL